MTNFKLINYYGQGVRDFPNAYKAAWAYLKRVDGEVTIAFTRSE